MATDFDFDAMLVKIKAKQWTLADIDWDQPGREQIRPEQRDNLKQFMTDLMWIEHIGARMMGLLGETAPTFTLKEIYRYFHAEEQRHANAELALLHRWNMIEPGEIPTPSSDIKSVLSMLNKFERVGDRNVPFMYFALIIPMFEVGLDGGIIKCLTSEVDDPVFHQVIQKINNDESRHLATGFAVMDMLGARSVATMLEEDIAPLLHPVLLMRVATLANPQLIRFLAFVTRVIDATTGMGMDIDDFYKAVQRFPTVGGRSANTRRLPLFHVISALVEHTEIFAKPQHRWHKFGRMINRYNVRRPLSSVPVPTFTRELNYHTVITADTKPLTLVT